MGLPAPLPIPHHLSSEWANGSRDRGGPRCAARAALEEAYELIREGKRRESGGKRERGQSSLLTHELPVVIRCLLRPSNELRRAMETFNRYIDGGRKRDPTTDLHRIENPNAKYGLVPQGSHAAGRIAGDTPATTALRLRQPPLHSGIGDWGQSSLLTLGLPVGIR